jgi:nucleotide-binding universal stress UspA family protein
MNLKKVLVASHGTHGARAAEQAAIELCAESGATLHHLLVVPDFWKGMMGDDWLNNAVTQSRFGDYVESQLAQDAAIELDRFASACEQTGVSCTSIVLLGKPAICLVRIADQESPDIAVIGSPRPKGTPGYRSRMDLELLARSLAIPLLTAPHP